LRHPSRAGVFEKVIEGKPLCARKPGFRIDKGLKSIEATLKAFVPDKVIKISKRKIYEVVR